MTMPQRSILPLAVISNVNTSPVTAFVHTDHLGRPTRMTDGTKATLWQATWKPWGEIQSFSGTQSLNQRFPGQYFQIETGLHYNWYRNYDPVTGRYTQPDPLRFIDGPSIYSYAGNSPFMMTDKKGLCAEDACVVETAIALCASNPACSAAAVATAAAVYGACVETGKAIRDWMSTPADDSEHKKNARPSTENKHEEGQARKKRDKFGGEKGDENREPFGKRPKRFKGVWPPK